MFENLSARDYYNVTGKLTEGHIRELLDLQDVEPLDTDGVEAYISEGKTQFPNEDFLQEVIDELTRFAKNVRGDNRQAVWRLAEELDRIQLQTHQATEYGLSELQLAINTLNGV